MATRITLTLSDRDLRFFREAVRHARRAVRDADEDEIVEAIRDIVTDIRSADPLPEFIAGRMPHLERLTDMLGDVEWQLPDTEREQLLAAFVYFCDPEDLIPDDLPGIGFLDDVIVIELLIREMHHVAEAYSDFCEFRRRYDAGSGDSADRDDRLDRRRRQLHARMRRRNAADLARGHKPSLW